MPLSDREKQILSEIESQLASSDAKLVKTLTRDPGSSTRLKLRYAIGGIIVGLLMLLAIAINPWGPYVAFAGFVLMLVSAVAAGNQLKRLADEGTSTLGGQLRGGLNRYLEGRRREGPGEE